MIKLKSEAHLNICQVNSDRITTSCIVSAFVDKVAAEWKIRLYKLFGIISEKLERV